MIKEILFNALKKIGHAIKPFFSFLHHHEYLISIVLGLLINLITECFSRHSVAEGFLHIIHSPLPFLFNSLIVITVLSIANFFKKRYCMTFLLGAVFLGFGIANGIVLANRVTPLEWADLQIVEFGILEIYLNLVEIILIPCLIAAAVAAIVVFFIKSPKSPVHHFKSAVFSVVCTVLLATSLIGFRSTGILMSEHVKNLANAYKDYGFNYCFLCSMLDLGIDKPSQYAKNDVSDIVSALDNSAGENEKINARKEAFQNENQPNIIFLQLETFFDVNHLSDIQFSENPIPNFTQLQKQYSSGYLTVPSIGAGTANTEFEVISGMSLEYFGVGEYPYKTILQKSDCESVCFNLSGLGYSNHAIHNNRASFYDRNKVFQNLGFDTFTSIEYMTDVEFTQNGWAKDNVLLQCITDALNSTESADFIYTISVQSHGKYPSDYEDELPISVSGFEDPAVNKSFQYYVNQLYEVDAVVGNILDALSSRDEKTIVVMFGDHLPSFDITEEDLLNNDLFQTEYVIWDNFSLEREEKDLYTYQLTAEVLGKIGCNEGLMTKLHQNFSDSEQYHNWMEILQYDTLYGKEYAYGGKNNHPRYATALQMGVKRISVSAVNINKAASTVTVTGENFTDFSKILLNGKAVSTEKTDVNTLVASDIKLEAGDYLSVAQIDKDNTVLSQTQNYIVGGTVKNPVLSVDTNNVFRPKTMDTVTAIAIIFVSTAIISLSFAIIYSTRRKNKASQKD